MIRRAPQAALLLLALSFLGAGCRSTGPLTFAPLPALTDAAQARAAAAEAGDPAEAAELAWLLGNDRAFARARLDAGLSRAPDDVGLRLRRALLSLEELDGDAMVEDLLEILRRRPRSAEAEVALVLLHEQLPYLKHRRAALQTGLHDSRLLDPGRTSDGGRIALAGALSARIARIDARDGQAQAALHRAGFLTQMRVLGPLAPFDPAAFRDPTRYERDADWEAPARFRGRVVPIREAHARAHPELELPESTPGLWVLDAYFEVSEAVAGAPVVLELRLPGSARVRVDDEVVLLKDAARRVEGRRTQVALRLAPGWHRISLSVLARPTDPISVALTTPDGRPLSRAARSGRVRFGPIDPEPAPEEADEQSALGLVRRLVERSEHAVFGRLLGARLAQSEWYRDLDRAAWMLAGTSGALPESAALAFGAARLAALRGEPTRARALLQDGLHDDPDHPGARVALARALYPDRPEAALDLLDGAAASAPDAWGPPAVRVLALRALGWTAPALEALEAAVARDPPDDVFTLGIRFLRGVEQHDRAARLEAALDRRDPRGAPARAAERAERAGDLDAAIAAHRRAAAIGDRAAALTRVAELELARLRPAAARAAALEAIAAAPHHGPAWRAHLRAAALEGDLAGLERALERLRALGESALELERLAGPLTPAPAGLEAALAHDPWSGVRPPRPDAPAPGVDPADRWAKHDQVVLLDRLVEHVLPDGRALSWHHDVTRLQTKEATDRAGELTVPPDALLLSSRTLKPDGRTVEVDRHAGKDDLSFSALAPGDAVERRWVQITGPATAYGGYWRRFYFRSADPLVRSELLVVAPAGAEVRHVLYNGAPAPRITRLGGRVAYHFRADDMLAVEPEPHAAEPDQFLPHVVVWVELEPEHTLRAPLAALGSATRGSRAVDRLAATLTSTIPRPQDRLTHLFRWVLEAVDDGPVAPPERVLSRGRGARGGLLVALARAAGVPAELALVQDGLHPPLEPPAPQTDAFGVRLVRAEPRPGQVVWASLDGDHPWLGPLPPHFAGGRALRAGPGGPRITPIPDQEVGRWPGASDLALEIDAAGTARGRLSLTIPAGRAKGTREFLRSARPAVLERQLQALLARLVRGARLVGHEARPLEDPLVDLELVLELEAPHFMTRDGDYLIAEELFERPLIGRAMGHPGLDAYLARAHRTTPLAIRPTVEQMQVSLTLPEGSAAPEVAPTAFERRIPHGRFAQTVTYAPAQRRLTMTLRYETDLGIVPPAELSTFTEPAQEVLQALRNRLVVRVTPSEGKHGSPPRAATSSRVN